MIHRRNIYILILFVSAVLATLIVRSEMTRGSGLVDLTNVQFASLDDRIEVSWHLPMFNNVKEIRVCVNSENGAYTDTISPRQYIYSISDGEHGTRYDITIQAQYQDGTLGECYSAQRLYLDYDQLPDLPTIYLTTVSGEDPTYEIAEAPEDDLWGISVKNNEYETGGISLEWTGHRTVSEQADIRIRGNTSSSGSQRPSYKIHLQQPTDMLNLGEEHASNNWLLLNNGWYLNNYIGEYLADRCGMEWVSHGMFVNVMLNNDWKGIYWLSESVDRQSAHAEILEDGYIFENDAYWWKDDTVYFRLEEQQREVAYTFKYPDLESADDVRVAALQQYMEIIYAYLATYNSGVSELIDYDSFAEWVMVRDIMHCGDAGGSNMYYYLRGLDLSNTSENRLKMGPLWDFDAGIQGAEYWFDEETGWSAQHSSSLAFYNYLFEMPDFCKVYKDKWEQISDGLIDNLVADLETLYTNYGEAIDASRQLSNTRWMVGVADLRTEMDVDIDLLSRQIDWINNAVQEW